MALLSGEVPLDCVKGYTSIQTPPLDAVKYHEGMNLVGLTEIARMLGVSRQRAHQLAQTDDFPRPAAELANGRVWEIDDVDAWMREREQRGTAAGHTEA